MPSSQQHQETKRHWRPELLIKLMLLVDVRQKSDSPRTEVSTTEHFHLQTYSEFSDNLGLQSSFWVGGCCWNKGKV